MQSYFRFEEESDRQILDALVSKPDYDKRVRPEGKKILLLYFILKNLHSV